MKIVKAIILVLAANLAQALEIKTASQDNSLVKFNPAKPDMPGICWEVIKALQKANPDLKFSGLENASPLPRIEQALENGDMDLFVCLLKSPERAEKFIFNEIPIYKVKHVVLAKADEKDLADMAALKAASEKDPVMVPQGSSLIKFLDAQGVKYDASSKDEVTSIKKLLAGRSRFAYGQDLSLIASIKESGVDPKLVKILSTVFKEEPQLVAFSKKTSPEVVKTVKAAIEKLEKSGEIAKIVAKYSK